jgi:alpha-tubulin suppressor-like RCC1 family protein
MTGSPRHSTKTRWLMAALTLSLWSASARATPPPLPRESEATESLDTWRRRATRHVLATWRRQSMMVGKDGSLWVWGLAPGQVMGTLPEYEVASATPVRMPGMTGVVSVAVAEDAMGSPALALMEDGTVQAWGEYNWWGQLGDGTTLPRQTRVTVQGLDQVVAISTAGSSLALRADGTVWGWGNNLCGNLGDGTQVDRPTPVQVVGLTEVVSVAAGLGYSIAVRADGTVWVWGCGFQGQFGDGTRGGERLTPAQVPGLTDVVAVETRADTLYALRADGTVWVWGTVLSGQHGRVPDSYLQLFPVQVPGLTQVVSLAAGWEHALAVRRDGTVWGWGSGNRGQLGDGTNGPIGPVRQLPGIHNAEAVAAGAGNSLVLKRDGTLWVLGSNADGTLGTGSDRRLSPAPVALESVSAVSSAGSHAMALRTDGTVWTWGASLEPSVPASFTPARVPGLDDVTRIRAGYYHRLALRADGTVWAWGQNHRGQLGDGTTPSRRTPSPVTGLTGVVAMATGYNHSLALRTDGTVWAWGANQYGQLGDMTLQDRRAPVQVQGLTDVVAVFAGRDLSLALRSDGSVWWWGSSALAWRRGDRKPHAPEPVQGLTNVVKLASEATVHAVRADGTVWRWTVGLPGEVNPAQQVAGFTDAVDVALSDNTVQVLRADGTVWNTGGNLFGERGFSSWLATPPGPSQVPGLTGVAALSAGSRHIHALRADGTLATWGLNVNGCIGDGVSTEHLTPVRVELPCRLTGLPSMAGSGQPQSCAQAP